MASYVHSVDDPDRALEAINRQRTFKLALAVALSRPPFRRTVAVGLAAMAAASLAALLAFLPRA